MNPARRDRGGTPYRRRDPIEHKGQTLFTINVQMRGFGSDIVGDLEPLQVWASSLREALALAIDRPFPDWFETEEEHG